MTETTNVATDQPEVVVILGMPHRLLANRNQTDGSLSVVEITVPAGGGAPIHTNTREALTWYVLDGTLTFMRDQDTVDVGAGRMIFLPKGRPHTFTNQTDQPATGLMICTPGGFEDFLTEVATALPADAPEGPPPAEALDAIQQIGARYGLQLSNG